MTLTATCHCRAVRIEVDAPPSYLNECHCSICFKYGVRWGYYRPTEVRFHAGPDATDYYSWGEKNLEFHRCRSCGCVTHWQDKDPTSNRLGLNACLFEPADIAQVPVCQSPGPPD